MKFRLSVPTEQKDALLRFFAEHGVETGDEGEYTVTESQDTSSFVPARDRERRSVRLSKDAIVYIEAFGKEIEIHTLKNVYLSQNRMYQLEALLDPKDFLRVSKSVIIAKKHVQKIRSGLSMKYVLTMTDGTLVDVTRSYYQEFRRSFGI